MHWTWDSDTFAANWFDEGNDRMPAPLRYHSRFPTLDEYEAHRAAVRAGYGARERELVDLLVHTLARCEMRVEILFGSVAYRGSDGVTRKDLRIVGARTATHAVVLRQTSTRDRDGEIRAQLLRADQLPAALGAAIPPCAPGTQRSASIDLGYLRRPPNGAGGNGQQRRADRGAGEHFRRLVSRPADGGGQAILRLGTFHDPHNRFRAMQWYDIAGDGRYLEQRTHTHLEVRPAAAQDFVSAFGGWVDAATRELRARAEEAYT